MRIGIDGRALSHPGGGEETYLRNVITALARADHDNEYVVFLKPAAPWRSSPDADHVRCVEIWPHNRFVRLFATFPLALMRERVDIVHAQSTVPPLSPVPTVITVHDISYERYPQCYLPAEVMRLRMLMPLMVRRAASILTVSEYSKWDIVRRYRVHPEKIVVAPNAADPVFRPLDDPEAVMAVRAQYRTGEHFILCVGNLQPRKNLQTLIAAYAKLRRADATRHKLVLVGRKTWLYDSIFDAARLSGYEDDLVFTDYVPKNDLVALYNAADVFVYPSVSEGFGLPPLEAMACGTPVVTSNVSSLPEVVGDAALTLDPLDAEALARGIASVLNDADLRLHLRKAGLQRATAFSWEATAKIITEVYHNTLNVDSGGISRQRSRASWLIERVSGT